MKKTLTMVSLVEDYVAARRRMGFGFDIAGKQLLGFARFADRMGHRGPITLDLAVKWAQSPPCRGRLTSARRIEVLRPFLKYRSQFDAGTATVSRDYFGLSHRRLVPHIYTPEEIAALLLATDSLLPKDGLRPATYRALFGLLAATGLRISEALHLRPEDVDLVRGILTVRRTKFCKSRLVPLHPTTITALKRYVEIRNRKRGGSRTGAFFVSDQGDFLNNRTVHSTFEKLRAKLRWVARGSYGAPRIHDMRHTFICRRLLDAYEKNQDPNSTIDAIATYVGHVKVTNTYWYLSATPELMGMAAQRFASFVERGGR
jgi:integrase